MFLGLNIRITFRYNLIQFNLALTLDLKSKGAFSEKDSYVVFLSYGALISSVTFVESMLFQLSRRHIIWQMLAQYENT